MPFLRAGYAGEGGALYDRSVSASPGYYRQLRKELAGFGLNWSCSSEGGFGPGLPDQHTAEIFYRFQLSDQAAITPDIRYIKDPALNPDEKQIWVLEASMKLTTGVLSVSLLTGAGTLAGTGMQTYLFVCDPETAYTVRAGPDDAWLLRPEGTLRLPALATGGAADLYSDGVFELWIDAEQDRARLVEAGAEPRFCSNDRNHAIDI